MKRLVVALVAVAVMGIPAAPAVAATTQRHDERSRCYEDDCGDDWGGGSNGNSGGDYEGGRSGDNDQRGDHNCRNFCFYGIPAPGGGGKDQQPQSLFPPNPAKIGEYIAQFAKLGLTFGQTLADTTIKFVTDLFTILA